ncbi:MAG: hypothetical protein WDN66_03800 [Candidatus Saccharibacteria bacterium]
MDGENQPPETPTQQNSQPPEVLTTQVPSSTDLDQPEPQLQLKKSHKSRSRIIAILVVILLVAAALVGVKLYNNWRSSRHEVALLRFGSDQPLPTSFYPNIGTDVFSTEINIQIFEGLTKFVKDTQVVPNLATSWANPE